MAGLLTAAVLIFPAGVLVGRRVAMAELARNHQVLAALVADSQAATEEATVLLRDGGYDLVVEVSNSLVERVLAQFRGYSQLTRRGNRFRITGLETHFMHGHAEVIARADFDWRWGLYDGPIEIVYYAFAQVTPDNECVLSFRVAEVHPLAHWPLFNRLLAPILTLRMQNNLAIKDFPLPLGLKNPAQAEAADSGEGPAPERRSLGRSGLRITVPPRVWDLKGRRVLAMFDEKRLGLLVESAGGSVGDARAGEVIPPPVGVEVAVRLALLSEMLASAVRPGPDIQISIDRLPRMWQNQGKLFGIAFDNHLDLRNVAGVIDIVGCRTTLADRTLGLDLEISGRFAGTAEARLFGVSFALPFKVRPTQVQHLPLRLVATDEGLGLSLGAREVSVPLEVDTSVGRIPLHASYALALPPEVIGRALVLPELRVAMVALPRRVERGKVLESLPVPVHVGWEIELPETLDGYVRAHGDLHFENGGVS